MSESKRGPGCHTGKRPFGSVPLPQAPPAPRPAPERQLPARHPGPEVPLPVLSIDALRHARSGPFPH